MLKLELVEERKTFLDHFSYGEIVGIMFLLLAIPTFFVLPFFKGFWIFPYIYSVLGCTLLSFLIYKLKFFFKFDYQPIGFVVLTSEQIEIQWKSTVERIDLRTIKLEILFNALRGRRFHFNRRDVIHSGISEFIIDDAHSIKIMLRTEKQLYALKAIIHQWYANNYALSEFTRNTEKFRLIELEADFEWKKLMRIKGN